jgi:hypothetical protein
MAVMKRNMSFFGKQNERTRVKAPGHIESSSEHECPPHTWLLDFGYQDSQRGQRDFGSTAAHTLGRYQTLQAA